MTIIWTQKAEKQFSKLDKSIQNKILNYMDEVAFLDNPRSRGKNLVGSLHGFWRYRVENYRILCKILDKQLIITVVQIGHRKEIYN